MRALWTAAILAALAATACRPASTPDASTVQLWLHATRGHETLIVPLVPGQPVDVPSERWIVADIRPWRGLLPRNTGVALVHFSIRPEGGEWVEDLVLKSGDQVVVDGRVSTRFEWSPDPAEQPPPEAGRWGLRENGRTSWSESFTPGTGFERSDGAVVTLLEREPGGAIRVRIDRSGGNETVTVEPGQEHASGVVNAAELAQGVLFRISASVPGNASVATADSVQEVELEPGVDTHLAGATIRLHDVQPDAVYVSPDASPWLEAVLSADKPGPDSRRVRVREGGLKALDDWRLRVTRERAQP